MSVETTADRASFIADFGAAVTWRASSFRAIFDRPTTMLPGLSQADIVDRMPTLCFPAENLPAGADEDDAVTVVDEFAVTHAFRCKLIRPDGTGFIVVDLKI